MLRWRGLVRFPSAPRSHRNLKIPDGWMIPKTVFSVFSGLLFGASLLASLCSAQTPVAARPLRLVPEPKEVQLHEGAGFRFGPGTVMLVDRRHQCEDRIAAETLAEEIAERAGFNVSIVGAPRSVVAGRSSVLARQCSAALRQPDAQISGEDCGGAAGAQALPRHQGFDANAGVGFLPRTVGGVFSVARLRLRSR
jgi:hypothetical protein